jgi:hypothetical protein
MYYLIVVNNLLENICGIAPESFTKVSPNDSSYIFSNDPNFPALNLYDFFGRAATVNSYTECFYYVELGFEAEKTTIFDFILPTLFFLTISFLFFKIYKNKVYKKIPYVINNLKPVRISGKLKKTTLVFFLIIQNFFLFNYVKTKAIRIPKFIDEYISLASNYNFFTTLDFNAGGFVGGSYSVLLTSGPISAIGGVLGWGLTTNLIISRISNFYWIVLLQLIFMFFINKRNEKDNYFLLFMSGIMMILVPWWQGSLYMIGEFSSVIFLINSIYLFTKYRKISLTLFCLSIFFGKLLTLIPFVIFYSFHIYRSKEYNKLITDFISFCIPLTIWFLLVGFNYAGGNLLNYVEDLYNLIIGHQSSGANSVTFLNSLASSEVSNWNNYDIFRLLIVPIFFTIIVFQNRHFIDTRFGNISIPLIAATASIYLWFWILSPTKWMRYSQHFSIMIIISLVYLINYELVNSKLMLFISAASLLVFIENTKNLIFFSIFLLFISIFLQTKFKYYRIVKLIIILLISIDIFIPYMEQNGSSDFGESIPECSTNLVSEKCIDYYLNE